MLRLQEAGYENAEKEWRFIKDMPEDENGLTNDWHGISRKEYLEAALPRMIAWSKGEDLPEGYVPETFFFLYDGEEIVGQFRVRHYLTDALREGAGHIGYFIRPDCRGKGYGTEGLKLFLPVVSRIVPEEEIYLRVRKYNVPSLKIMLKNGGRIAAEDQECCYVRIPKTVN